MRQHVYSALVSPLLAIVRGPQLFLIGKCPYFLKLYILASKYYHFALLKGMITNTSLGWTKGISAGTCPERPTCCSYGLLPLAHCSSKSPGDTLDFSLSLFPSPSPSLHLNQQEIRPAVPSEHYPHPIHFHHRPCYCPRPKPLSSKFLQ